MRRIALLLAVLLALVSPITASAQQYVRDLIVTNTDAPWVDVRAYTTLTAAIGDIAGADVTLLIPEPVTCVNLTIPATMRLRFSGDGMITTTGTLLIQTRHIEAASVQIFAVAGAGAINFADGTLVKSSWFADLENALTQVANDSVRLRITEADTVAANVAIGADVILEWVSPDCEMAVDPTFTISNVHEIIAGEYTILTGGGDYDFVNGTRLKSSWFERLSSIDGYAGADHIQVTITEDETFIANVAFPPTMTFIFPYGNVLTIPIARTISFDGWIHAGPYQIFSVAGTLNIVEYSGLIFDQWTGGTGGVSLRDSDGDTMVQVEEAADEDKIRWDTGGAQRGQIDVAGMVLTVPFELSAGTSINEISIDTTLAGNSDDAVPTEKAVKAYVDPIDAQNFILGTTADYYVRVIKLDIRDGTNATTIRLQVFPGWNGDTVAAEDNIGKPHVGGDYSLSADGKTITVEAAGLTGNVIAILSAQLTFNDTTSDLLVFAVELGNDFTVNIINHQSLAYRDWTVAADESNGTMMVMITYLTDA